MVNVFQKCRSDTDDKIWWAPLFFISMFRRHQQKRSWLAKLWRRQQSTIPQREQGEMQDNPSTVSVLSVLQEKVMESEGLTDQVSFMCFYSCGITNTKSILKCRSEKNKQSLRNNKPCTYFSTKSEELMCQYCQLNGDTDPDHTIKYCIDQFPLGFQLSSILTDFFLSSHLIYNLRANFNKQT